MAALRDAFALFVFVILQILLLPLQVITCSILVAFMTIRSRQLGTSGTALYVFNDRWVLHIFKLRQDAAADAIAHTLPTNLPTATKFLIFPFYVYYSISGKYIHPQLAAPGEERARHLVENRTIYIDALLSSADVGQLVVLGAGFDTRCYTSQLRKRFELDQPRTQQLKRDALRAARVDTSGVRFISVDFATRDWTKSLIDAGFDRDVPAVFLWEGVTLYLTENDVRATLAAIKRVSAPGSVIIADFYSSRFKAGLTPMMRYAYQILKVTNEQLAFTLDFENDGRKKLSQFLESEGLRLGEAHMMGSKTEIGAWMSVAEVHI